MDMLTRWIATEDIDIIDRAGERFTETAQKIILTAERGNFRNDADADSYAMNRLADLVAAARKICDRIITEHEKKDGRGVALMTSNRGYGYVIRTYQAYTNDGRAWGNYLFASNETEARAIANRLWIELD